MKTVRKIIHGAIQRYLLSAGGAFHTNVYGSKGRYVVLMNEDQYHEYRQRVCGLGGAA